MNARVAAIVSSECVDGSQSTLHIQRVHVTVARKAVFYPYPIHVSAVEKEAIYSLEAKMSPEVPLQISRCCPDDEL